MRSVFTDLITQLTVKTKTLTLVSEALEALTFVYTFSSG